MERRGVSPITGAEGWSYGAFGQDQRGPIEVPLAKWEDVQGLGG